MNIKMVVVDLDHTLLRDDDSISQKTINTFKKLKEKNIIAAIATGRMEFESMFAKEAIDANYMITGNGGKAYDYNLDKTIYKNYMDKNTALSIAKVIEKYDNITPLMMTDEGQYCEEKYFKYYKDADLTEAYFNNFTKYIKIIDSYENSIKNDDVNVYKFFLNSKYHEILLNMQKDLSFVKDLKTPFSKNGILEVIPSSIDKGVALIKLSEYLQIDIKNIMAIGDSENDIEMIKTAGVKVAVGNANDKIKKLAEYIAPSNNEDGVSQIIEKLLF